MTKLSSSAAVYNYNNTNISNNINDLSKYSPSIYPMNNEQYARSIYSNPALLPPIPYPIMPAQYLSKMNTPYNQPGSTSSNFQASSSSTNIHSYPTNSRDYSTGYNNRTTMLDRSYPSQQQQSQSSIISNWNMSSLQNSLPSLSLSNNNPNNNILSNRFISSTSSSVSNYNSDRHTKQEHIEIDKPFELNLLRSISSPTDTNNIQNDNVNNTSYPHNIDMSFLRDNSFISESSITPPPVMNSLYPSSISTADTLVNTSADITGTTNTPLSWISRTSTPDRLHMVSNILNDMNRSTDMNLSTANRTDYSSNLSTFINNQSSSLEDNHIYSHASPVLSSIDVHASSSSSLSTAYSTNVSPVSTSSITGSGNVHPHLPRLKIHSIPTYPNGNISPPTLRPTTMVQDTNISSSSSSSDTSMVHPLSSRDGITLERLHGVHWPMTTPSNSTAPLSNISSAEQFTGGNMEQKGSSNSSSSTPIWPPLPNTDLGLENTSISSLLNNVSSSSLSSSSVSTTEDTSLRIFVGKIGVHTNITSLWNYFLTILNDLGFTDTQRAIEDIYYPYDEHGHPRGFAFVSFTCPAAYQAIASVNQHIIDGRIVVIDTAIPRGLKPGPPIVSSSTNISNTDYRNPPIVSSAALYTTTNNTNNNSPLLSSINNMVNNNPSVVSSLSMNSSFIPPSRLPPMLPVRTAIDNILVHPTSFMSPSGSSISGLPSPIARVVNHAVATPRPESRSNFMGMNN